MPRCSSWVYIECYLSGECCGYRVEEVATAGGSFNLLEQLFIVRVIINRIDLRRINYQERAFIVGMKKPRICVRQFFQISTIDVPITVRVAPRKPLHQRVDGCLQVDNEVGYRRV